MNGLKIESKKKRRTLDATDICLRRLVKAPETVNQIYDLAESLYMRDGGATARLSLADIEQVGEVLRQTEKDIERMKKQFCDLAMVEGNFLPEIIPIGF
ncbi:MAG: hypothetical protein H0W58_16375 [Acidobacteria bacterium]|jgi:hypothetical protein|nr:hypothetical protein [Acidobacteriota bacterium]